MNCSISIPNLLNTIYQLLYCYSHRICNFGILMKIKEAKYIGSFPSIEKSPPGLLPEYAFIGRSNVGKSSLINALTGRTELAHISKKPGKTQSINYFLINEKWHLVDLPGYGYAVISKKQRAKWRLMINGYLQKRVNLQTALVLIDSNVPPQKIDIDFINWCGQEGIPFSIVFTKIDRLKPSKLKENIANFQNALLEYWEELPRQFVTSSIKNEGTEEILEFIETINKDFVY